jgi:hypothetical protein
MKEVLKEGLHEYIDRLQEKLNDVGQTIFETFVLYADILTPEQEASTTAPAIIPGAFHTILSSDIQMQQQQQQQA